MIVKITFLDLNDKELTMMFGNSYKNWFTQFEEYLYQAIRWWNAKEIMSCDIYKIIDVQKASDSWVGFGGLKWCSEKEFQGSLDHEGEGLGWKRGRQYQDMSFSYDNNKYYKTRKGLRDRLRHLGTKNVSQNLEIKKEIKKFNDNK